jgi:hypothetical protein
MRGGNVTCHAEFGDWAFGRRDGAADADPLLTSRGRSRFRLRSTRATDLRSRESSPTFCMSIAFVRGMRRRAVSLERCGSSGTRVEPLNARVNFSSSARKSFLSRAVKADSTRFLALRAGAASSDSNFSPAVVSRRLCRRRSCAPMDRTTRPSCSSFLSTIPVVERSRPNRLAREI